MSTHFNTKQLSLIIVFSALGAIASVPIGHLGNYLKTIPFLPLGSGQILAGLHLIMVVLAALYVKKPGVAAMTGAVKGLAEAVLFSFHGLPVIVMSAVQGAIIDAVLVVMGYNTKAILIGCGLSAASNVVFIQFFLGRPFPFAVYALMYVLAITSGVIFGGYMGNKLFQRVEERLP
jgi:ABC-type thiamin/hydroxymethylpyrimidine transport system permease subunit